MDSVALEFNNKKLLMNIFKNIDEVISSGQLLDNSLVQGDCLEIMPFIKDESVDMILCDLPFGTTDCSWDIIIPFDKLWEQYERIIKSNGIIILHGVQPFTSQLIMSNLKLFRYELIWDKVFGVSALNSKFRPMISHENILVFYKHKPTFNPIFLEKT